MKRALGACIAFLLSFVASPAIPGRAAPSDKSADQIDVELMVRAPDGQPLDNVPVLLRTMEPTTRPAEPAAVKTATDAQGWIRCKWPTDQPQIFVLAEGVGFGATGAFAVEPGKIARPALPPLAPSGTIEGTAPTELRREGVTIWLSGWEWLVAETACDTKGRFKMLNVPAGLHFLKAGSREPNAYRILAGESVTVAPGQHVVDVRLVSEPQHDEPDRESTTNRRGEHKDIVWAEGSVRDEGGQPIENAEVIARAEHHYGLRMFEIAFSTTTDAQGRWQIVGDSGLSAFRGHLLVHKIGRPYVIAELKEPTGNLVDDLDGPKAKGGADRAPRNNSFYDWVLPSPGGRLNVLVTRHGKPLADAAVWLAPSHDIDFLSTTNVGAGRSAAGGRGMDIMNPIVDTDETGTARFVDLPAGSYKIIATDAGRVGLLNAWERAFHDVKGITREFHGVAIQPGPPRKFHAELDRCASSVRMGIRQPSGDSVAKVEGRFSWTKMAKDDADTWGTEHVGDEAVILDDHGQHAHSFIDQGLWQVSYTFVEPPSKPVELFRPYRKAPAIIAASPLLDGSPRIEAIATIHRDVPASLRVQLQDTAGKPARGYIYLGSQFEPFRATATDAQGEVVFQGVTERLAKVKAFLPGLKSPSDISHDPRIWPADKDLIGRFAYFVEDVTPDSNREMRLAMRPKPVGYVRGVVHAAQGTELESYVVTAWNNPTPEEFVNQFDKKTGKFLLGPFAEGPVILHLNSRTYGKKHRWATALIRKVDIASNRVSVLELNAPAPANAPSLPDPERIFLSDWESETLEGGGRKFGGVVYLPDGNTPALGAKVYLFVPGRPEAVAYGKADFAGAFKMVDSRYSYEKIEGEVKLIDKPTIVAILPGIHGATVLPVDDPNHCDNLTLVLPRSLSLQGVIAIGGRAPSSNAGALTVAVAYQNDSVFRPFVSQSCSADADGSFLLSGLTPGKYRVQAALDDIWLSNSEQVELKADFDQSALLTLNIGEPGCATVITLVDQQGNEVRDAEVTLFRPVGPLAARLWPNKLVSDHAGVVYVPPLEMGEHKFAIAGRQDVHQLSVAKLGIPHKPAKVTIKVNPTR